MRTFVRVRELVLEMPAVQYTLQYVVPQQSLGVLHGDANERTIRATVWEQGLMDLLASALVGAESFEVVVVSKDCHGVVGGCKLPEQKI